MANTLTAVRLLLALPVAAAFARPDFVEPAVLFCLVCLAIASDSLDGRVARATGAASPAGQVFDHATDCIFVTAGMIGAAVVGGVPVALPVLIVIAFSQYLLDSYFLHRQKELRMSTIGRWNGIFYFVPLVILSGSRLPLFSAFEPFLLETVTVAAYGLIVSTVISITDRALATVVSQRD